MYNKLTMLKCNKNTNECLFILLWSNGDIKWTNQEKKEEIWWLKSEIKLIPENKHEWL